MPRIWYSGDPSVQPTPGADREWLPGGYNDLSDEDAARLPVDQPGSPYHSTEPQSESSAAAVRPETASAPESIPESVPVEAVASPEIPATPVEQPAAEPGTEGV